MGGLSSSGVGMDKNMDFELKLTNHPFYRNDKLKCTETDLGD